VLTQMLPDDINPALAQAGLLCSDLVLQATVPTGEKLQETAGQSKAAGINRGE
jgi:hypothetical protein